MQIHSADKWRKPSSKVLVGIPAQGVKQGVGGILNACFQSAIGNPGVATGVLFENRDPINYVSGYKMNGAWKIQV